RGPNSHHHHPYVARPPPPPLMTLVGTFGLRIRTRGDEVENGTITVVEVIIGDGNGRKWAGMGRLEWVGIWRLEWLEWAGIRRLEWLSKGKGRLE
ncbi:hypothetical protein Tco_0460325, partial [Tanacetum coccineum]